jgi:uncharacterized protein (DUF1015 family)
VKRQAPLYDFVSEDGIGHRVFEIENEADIADVSKAFDKLGCVYIADGHHRCASAVRVALERRKKNPEYTGDEEYNYFLSVLFPDEELMIMPYNRLIKDLNGMSTEGFLNIVKSIFVVEKVNDGSEAPTEKGSFYMFLDKTWYKCTIKAEDIDDRDPVAGLDVSVLQDQLLGPVLGIKDPKTDERIDFCGGIKGTAELVKRCESDCAVAFSMYPTSIAELFNVADAGRLMPPKSTWFEPKLRSGLFIHEIGHGK